MKRKTKREESIRPNMNSKLYAAPVSTITDSGSNSDSTASQPTETSKTSLDAATIEGIFWMSWVLLIVVVAPLIGLLSRLYYGK